ncbi:MAG: class I SAM-dependent methyltransferase, partial [Alphaproteobacteria bacterium]|nr:class I SAM-dependent methyltransferase [Alphaproteobacteria bacterium]
LQQPFDAVVIAGNSLLHLHSTEDFGRVFTAIRQHLAPGGTLYFDVFVPNPRLLSLPIGQRETLGTFAHAHLGDVTVEETICYDPVSQISRADWYWSTAAHRDFRHTPLELRQIYPQELPLLLALGGLELKARYGDFDGSALTARSPRQVCVAIDSRGR